MLRAILPLLVLLCIGCKAPMATVRFESDPPGARIYKIYHPLTEFEKAKQTASYMGTTPFEAQMRVTGNREVDPENQVFLANDFVRPQVTFMAEPPKGVTTTNQFRTFMGGAMFHPGDRLPDAILFDFTR
jgi:hypothetical protein